ncbi:hypothetical protein SASPL_156154 [Salvia splendens]|uniref:Uncharacterized protein n=1 Tax=Salvia splendens TaxID=180675 RepID=A0A8X8VXH6_SALSN|nr:hypothetical protein SASPL_156154 [Salvia splendens]
MKNVAKCDTWCELQNPVNHRVFERKLRPKPFGRGHVCLGVTHRVAPHPARLAPGRGADIGLPFASACGWPKCDPSATRVTTSAGPPIDSGHGPARIAAAAKARAVDMLVERRRCDRGGQRAPRACFGNCVLPVLACGLPIRPVLKHGPRGLTCVRVNGLVNPLPTLETAQPEVGSSGWKSTARRVVSGAPPAALENPEDRVPSAPGRTHNRIRSPRIGSEDWARGSQSRTRRLPANCSSCSRGESGSSRAGRGTDWERLLRGPSPGIERSAQNCALNVKVKKFNQARVNGGSNYDSLKRNHSQGNGLGEISGERRPLRIRTVKAWPNDPLDLRNLKLEVSENRIHQVLDCSPTNRERELGLDRRETVDNKIMNARQVVHGPDIRSPSRCLAHSLGGQGHATFSILYLGSSRADVDEECYLVDPASSHMLVSKIKPCMFKKLVVGLWAGSAGPPHGVHRSSRPFCRRCAPGLNWPGRASGAVTLKKLECSKQAYALDTLAWDNIIGFRRTTAKAFAKNVFINQERKLGARRRSDTVLVSTINDADQGSADVAFRTPPAPYEKSKYLGSGGSMVARLKLKGIDGRAPPGVEPAA